MALTPVSGSVLTKSSARSAPAVMGEEFLARDTKLDRNVALKILPVDVASNRDRMERFVREAKPQRH